MDLHLNSPDEGSPSGHLSSPEIISVYWGFGKGCMEEVSLDLYLFIAHSVTVYWFSFIC